MLVTLLYFPFQNVLELGLYDKDVVTQDDHLFTVYFDIAKLSLGEQVFMHFKCDSQVRSQITYRICSQEPFLSAFLPKMLFEMSFFIVLVYGLPNHIKGRSFSTLT